MYDPELNERRSDYDWPLAAAVLGLMILGTAFIFSATESQAALRTAYLHQMLWYGLGVGAAARPATSSTAAWRAGRRCFIGLRLLLLLAVYALGAVHHGGKRWIFWGFAAFGICQDSVSSCGWPII
jgi:cell division protein FtsW (lipid II flippase)